MVTEAGSYLRLIYSCITQLKAQGPYRTCNESEEEEEESLGPTDPPFRAGVHQFVPMIKWIWTSRLSIKNSLALMADGCGYPKMREGVNRPES